MKSYRLLSRNELTATELAFELLISNRSNAWFQGWRIGAFDYPQLEKIVEEMLAPKIYCYHDQLTSKERILVLKQLRRTQSVRLDVLFEMLRGYYMYNFSAIPFRYRVRHFIELNDHSDIDEDFLFNLDDKLRALFSHNTY